MPSFLDVCPTFFVIVTITQNTLKSLLDLSLERRLKGSSPTKVICSVRWESFDNAVVMCYE